MITGIVVALPEELATLTADKVERGTVAFLTDNTLLAFAGAGPANARKAARLAVDRGAKRLVSWGCAAALSTELKPGDLVIADTLLTLNKPPLHCNRNWTEHTHRLIADRAAVHRGSLASNSSIVGDRRHKRTLYAQTSALAVDMESYEIAAIAESNGMPCLVLRTIADPADMTLPNAVEHALNAEGEIEFSKLIGYLLTHPLEIPGLIRLGIHFSAAKKTLRLIGKDLDKITEFYRNNTEL